MSATTDTPAAQPKGIIWVASYPKSGNTWTRNFLHNLISVRMSETDASHDINKMMERSTWELFAKPYEDILGKPVETCE